METFKGFPPRPQNEGYTAVPNIFFDEVLPKINNMSELKVLLAVFRKTYGWVKDIDRETGQPVYKLEDEISYSQFEELTGLSSTSVATGISRAIKNGYLIKVRQGDTSGVTSKYRVATNELINNEIRKDGLPLIEENQEKQPPKIEYLPITDLPVSNQKTPLKATSLNELLNKQKQQETSLAPEKQEILNEIFGGSKEEKPEEKEEKKKSPHNTFISNWYRCYFSKFNISYGEITGKEHKHIKLLTNEYGIDVLIKAMEFYMSNYDKLEGVPNDYPTITVFYAWRKKIIPMSILGKVEKPTKSSKKSSREFDEKAWEESGDFFDN